MGITVLQSDITVRNRITSGEPPDTALSSFTSTKYGTFDISFRSTKYGTSDITFLQFTSSKKKIRNQVYKKVLKVNNEEKDG